MTRDALGLSGRSRAQVHRDIGRHPGRRAHGGGVISPTRKRSSGRLDCSVAPRRRLVGDPEVGLDLPEARPVAHPRGIGCRTTPRCRSRRRSLTRCRSTTTRASGNTSGAAGIEVTRWRRETAPAPVVEVSAARRPARLSGGSCLPVLLLATEEAGHVYTWTHGGRREPEGARRELQGLVNGLVPDQGRRQALPHPRSRRAAREVYPHGTVRESRSAERSTGWNGSARGRRHDLLDHPRGRRNRARGRRAVFSGVPESDARVHDLRRLGRHRHGVRTRARARSGSRRRASGAQARRVDSMSNLFVLANACAGWTPEEWSALERDYHGARRRAERFGGSLESFGGRPAERRRLNFSGLSRGHWDRDYWETITAPEYWAEGRATWTHSPSPARTSVGIISRRAGRISRRGRRISWRFLHRGFPGRRSRRARLTGSHGARRSSRACGRWGTGIGCALTWIREQGWAPEGVPEGDD